MKITAHFPWASRHFMIYCFKKILMNSDSELFLNQIRSDITFVRLRIFLCAYVINGYTYACIYVRMYVYVCIIVYLYSPLDTALITTYTISKIIVNKFLLSLLSFSINSFVLICRQPSPHHISNFRFYILSLQDTRD